MSDASSGGGYKLPKATRRRKVPPRHTVFTNPLTIGPALHTQQRQQRTQVRKAQEALPGPAVRLPIRPKLAGGYTPAQRKDIIAATSKAIRHATATGALDPYLAHRQGEESLYSQLGHLTDRRTRQAIHKYAGAVQTAQLHSDALLGHEWAQTHLSPTAPTLKNLAAIGKRIRETQLASDISMHGQIKPGGTPTGVGPSISGFLNDRVFNYAPNLRILTLPTELAKATIKDPIGVAKTSARTAIESIAGIPEGVKELVTDPGHALSAMGKDYSHRYGPLLQGNTGKFERQVQTESGLTPFAFDAAAAGVPAGRLLGAAARTGTAGRIADTLTAAKEPILSRVIRAAHETATMKRPALRFSGGEGGAVGQETAQNLFKAAGQRGLDTARRRKFAKKAERAGLRQADSGHLERIPGATETARLPGLRPGTNEVLPYYSLREAVPFRRLTGRVARDIGETKSKGRIRLLTQRARALHDIEAQMKRLSPEERAALFPAIKYGLPAVKDAATREQALAAIERRLAQIKRERKTSGRGVSRVLGETNDEVKLLRDIRRAPEAYLTPTLRDAADNLVKVQKREQALDPDLTPARASIRANTPQGALLDVRRGPDVQYLQDRLRELELVQQARGRHIAPGQLQESHGALAEMHPQDRPAAATAIEAQAKARLNATERVLQSAREDLAGRQGRAQVLSRNVTGTRAGEEAAAAGGGLGVAQADEAVHAAEAARNAARDTYAAARDATKLVKDKGTMRLEPADAFDARVRKAAEQAGLSEPGYWMSTPRPTETYSDAAIGTGGRAVARSRHYTGALHDIGAETHTPDIFVHGVERNIKRRFSWALVSRNVEVHAFEWSRGVRGEGLTASEILRALDERHIDEKTVALLNARIVRGRPTEEAGVARGNVVDHATTEDTLLQEVHSDLVDSRVTLKDLQAEEAQGQAMNRYLAAPKEVVDELQHATVLDGPVARAAEIILKQKPARILLGAANVPWLMFQIASNAFLTGLGGGLNPLDIFGAHKWWRGLDHAEQDAVEVELGITHGRHFALDQTHLGSTTNQLGPAKHLVDFWHAYKKSRVGRTLHKGNIMDAMFRADEAQNNFFRKVLFYNKAKKTAYREMGANWRSIDGVQKKLMSTLALPPERMGGEIVKKGADFEQHAKHVNDFLGNYLTFSARERNLLSRNVMFYGYLRYSLRFAFWTMPVEHPLITSIISNIGRMGSDEVKQLFGVPLDYRLPTSMLGKIYFGANPDQVRQYVQSGGTQGKLPSSVNVGRMNPFLNAATQVDPQVPSQALGVASPLYQMLADQLINKSTYTGKDFQIDGQPTPAAAQRPRSYYGSIADMVIPGTPRNRIIVNQLLGLVYPYRLATQTGIPALGIKPMLGPQGDDSLLWSQRPIQYKSAQVKQSIKRTTGAQAGEPRLRNQILPFFPQADTGPIVVARDRQKLADELNQGQGKKKKAKAKASYSYGPSSSSSAYGGSSSSYKSRYGG